MLKFLSRHHFSGTLQEQQQNLQGLFGKPHLQVLLTQLAGLHVEMEISNAYGGG
ncbi:MAG: hypothetical protein ACXW3E_00630 [Thermoanaerobaculia bacterium]